MAALTVLDLMLANLGARMDRDHQEHILQIKGRHDPVIVPRAVVVVESMAALTVLDLMLANLGARMDTLEKIYK